MTVLLCIKKLYKSFLDTNFAGGIRDFVTQGTTYHNRKNMVAAMKKVTGMDKSSQNSRKLIPPSEIHK